MSVVFALALGPTPRLYLGAGQRALQMGMYAAMEPWSVGLVLARSWRTSYR